MPSTRSFLFNAPRFFHIDMSSWIVGILAYLPDGMKVLFFWLFLQNAILVTFESEFYPETNFFITNAFLG